MDLDTAKCFTESVEKQQRTRLKWFSKNYEKLAAENRKPVKKDEVLMEQLAKQRAETAQATPRFVHQRKTMPLPERDLSVNLDIMKPVPPEVRELIYHGLSHEGEGPYSYLKVRYQEDPDDKFYFTECTNWTYGWGIKSVELHKLFRLPRVQIMQQSFYRRGGVERDPDHYRDAVNMEAPLVFPQI